MVVQGMLVGAEDARSGVKDGKEWAMQQMHILLDSDKPRCGKVAMTGAINPRDYIAGSTPEKFPRNCKVGIEMTPNRPARIVSVMCE